MNQGQLKIVPGKWYAWQMIPGYVGQRNVPYCSPIFVNHVKPLKTGKNILGVSFLNVFYAEGVQDFGMDLRILKHEADYLIAELLYGDDHNDRAAVISHIEFGWIERFCPSLWNAQPPILCSQNAQGSVQFYLNEVFNIGDHQLGQEER